MSSTNKFLLVIVAGVLFAGIGQGVRTAHDRARVNVIDDNCAKTGVVLVNRRDNTISEVVDCRGTKQAIYNILDEK